MTFTNPDLPYSFSVLGAFCCTLFLTLARTGFHICSGLSVLRHRLSHAAFEGAPEEIDVTVFPADGEAAASAERGAKALVAEAHQARQFTDIASFTLRCCPREQQISDEWFVWEL